MKELNLKLDRNLLILFLIIGMISNLSVMLLNDDRMPVKSDSYINTNEHFSFTNKNTITLYQASSRYGFTFANFEIRYSIGDLIILLGIIGITYITIKLIIIQCQPLKSIKNR